MKDKYDNDNKSKLLDVLPNDIRVYIIMTNLVMVTVWGDRSHARLLSAGDPPETPRLMNTYKYVLIPICKRVAQGKIEENFLKYSFLLLFRH